jgi:GTP cyclohydrolase I
MEFDDLAEDATTGLLRETAGIDEERVAAAVREILAAIGEDPQRPDLVHTPERIARMYQELFAGIHFDPRQILREILEESHDEMVIVRDIPFFSLCEHHLLPFYGVAHVGYFPSGRVVGISKLARVVEAFARRPQVQERLTTQVADCIQECLRPGGVAVVMEAEHLCMTMRGVKKPGSRVITSAVRGAFRRRAVTRAEFLSLVQGR